MAKTHEMLIKIASSIDSKFGTNVQKVISGTGKINEKLEKLRQSQDKVKDLQIQVKGYEKLQKQMQTAQAKNEALTADINKFKDSLNGIEKGSDKYNEIEKSIKSLERQQAKLNIQQGNFEKESKNISDGLAKEGLSTKKLSYEKEKLISTEKKLKNQMDKLNKSGKDQGDVFSKLTSVLKAVAGPAVIAGIIHMGMTFSNSIAQVSTVADSSQVSMKTMSTEILKLSKDTGIAAGLLSKDVYDSISSGVQTADAVKTVATNSKLAKAGFAESGQSLDLLTTIVNGYGKSMKEADKISDILINTQNKGKVTVAQLSSSMGKIIPTANASKVNLEQIASGYALMTSKGIAAAESTTYMSSMINELSKNGSTANKALKAATGKTLPDLMKSGKSLGDVLSMVNSYAGKKKLNLADMFGSAEAGKAALILATNGGKDFNTMVKSMENSTGATQDAFNKLNAEPIEKLNKSMNNLKVKGIELGLEMLPVVNKILDSVLKLTNLPIKPAIDWMTGGSTKAKLFRTALVTLGTGIGVYVGAVKTVSLVTKGWTAAQAGFNVVMQANPTYRVVAVLAGLAVGLVYAYKHSERFRNIVNASWIELKNLGAIIATIPGKAKGIWNGVTNKTAEFCQKIKDTGSSIKGLWDKIRDNPFGKFVTDIALIMNPITRAITLINKLKDGWQKLKNLGDFGKEDKKSTQVVTSKPFNLFAKGGISNKPAIFGEAGPEMAIPLKKDERSKSLWLQTGNILGLFNTNKDSKGIKEKKSLFSSQKIAEKNQTIKNSTNAVVNKFEIKFEIKVEGAVDKKEAIETGNQIGETAANKFINKLKEYEKNQRRLSFE